MALTPLKAVTKAAAPAIVEPQISVRLAMNCVEAWLEHSEQKAPLPSQLHFGLFLRQELPKLAAALLLAEQQKEELSRAG